MAVAGLRGTGSYSADERPTNYRGVLALLNPNTEAPLTALTGAMRDMPTDDPEFNCFTKGLPVQRAVVSATVNTTVTTITLQGTGSQLIFKKGHAIINEATQEVMWVVSAATAKTIVVERGKGTAKAAIATNAGLFILGTHHEEGADVPPAITYDPTVVTNYTQIFRTSVDLTGTAQATRLRYADNPMVEMKREALEIHAIEMEKQYFFGSGVEDTTGAQPERTTKGLFFFITTNADDFNDSVTVDNWNAYLRDVFEDGKNEKMHFCGNQQIVVFNKIAETQGQINISPRSDTYGLQVMTWLTPFGTLAIKQHPLFSKNPTFKDWGFTVEMSRIHYRHLRGRDTKYLRNRQSPGHDATKDEFMTECGLEVDFEQYHGLAKNFSAFSA